MIDWLVSWLLTYWIHSTLLLGLVFAVERLGWVRRRALAEALWKVALVGGIVTTSLQIGVIGHPLFKGYEISRPPAAAVAITALAEKTVPTGPIEPKTAPATPHGYVIKPAQPSAVNLATYWREALLVFWAIGLLLLAARLMRAMATARRELRGRVPLTNPAIRSRVSRLAGRAGLRRAPRVSVLSELAGPMSLPNGEICVPEWTLSQLNSTQLDALLAHEIAHCARRDPQWLLANIAVCTLLFLQPLNAFARRRLAALAELACDDWAAESTGDSRPLLECLARCAERMTPSTAARFAPAMAVQRSALMVRAERLARGERESGRLTPMTMLLILAFLPIFAFIAPGFGLSAVAAAPTMSAAQADRYSDVHVHINGNDDNGRHSIDIGLGNGKHQIQFQSHGKVIFDKSGAGIAGMAPGATMTASEKRDGIRYRAFFRAVGGNRIDKHFYINGSEKPYDEKAEHWLARIIPVVVRDSGINAAARVQYILAKRGPGGVLAEIRKIDSGCDYARSLYLRELVADEKLAPGLIDSTIKQTDRIQSGYALGQTLKAIVAHQSLSDAQMLGILNGAKNIKSDYEAGQVLQAVAARLTTPDPALVRAYLKVVNGIRSDYTRSQTLLALIRGINSDARTMDVLPDATGDISSDYARLSVLKALAGKMPNDPALAAKYRKLAQSMDQYARQAAERALARRKGGAS